MALISEDKVKRIGLVLNDENRPLKERFRALFTLKNIGGSCAIKYISQCFNDPSALLKHELAYCLGQMKDKTALPILISVLKDNSQEPMVRHEAGGCFKRGYYIKYLIKVEIVGYNSEFTGIGISIGSLLLQYFKSIIYS